MNKRETKQVRVGIKLVPTVERLASLRRENFSATANYLISKGINTQEIDMTPGKVKEVLPGFDTDELMELAIAILTIVGSRKTEVSIEGQQAIAAWTKLINGEKLTMPDMSRLAEATGTSLDEVRSALEKGEDEY